MEYLILGQVNKPFGLKGEVKIFSKTDFASFRYKKGSLVFYKDEDTFKPLKIHSYRESKPFDIVSFEGYLDINLISFLLNKVIYIKKEDAKIPNDYYFYSDLVGLNVIYKGINYGVIKEVIEIPVNVLLRVSYKDKIYDIPYVKSFINKIDLKNKLIDVNLIDGMI